MVLCVLLLVFSALTGEGCRDQEATTSPAPPAAFALNMPVGAQFFYDTWTLDLSYDPQNRSTKTTTSWYVVSTQAQYQGMSGVTVIADSAVTGRDTLYLAPTSNGNLYFYGFLSRIMKQRRGYDLPRRWDLIASFSAGMTGLWTVGFADSLGQDVVYGNIASSSDYYTTKVDSVTEVFPAYRIDLTGQTLYYSIWFSNSPNAFVRLLEEPAYDAKGQLMELAGVKTGAR